MATSGHPDLARQSVGSNRTNPDAHAKGNAFGHARTDGSARDPATRGEQPRSRSD